MKYNKLIITAQIIILVYNNSIAQRYVFEEIQDTSFFFQPLDTNAIQGYTENIVAIPIGFDFDFYDKTFDSLYITHKGHFIFKLQDNDSIIDYGEFVMGDYKLENGTVLYNDTLFFKYKTTGEIGNRIFIYECIDLGFFVDLFMCFTSENNYSNHFYTYYKNIDSTGSVISEWMFVNYEGCDSIFFTERFNINYQLKLYEKNGNIEIQYGNRFYPLDLDVVFKVSDEREDVTCLTGSSSTITFRHDKHYENDDYYFSIEFLYHYNIYRFYLDDTDKILINDKDILFQNLKGNKYTFGAFPGHNIWLDYTWAEKFYISKPILLKGIVSQNFGRAISEDSASYSIYTVGDDNLPDRLLNHKKIAYKCLNLDGNLNIVLFDSIIEIDEPFYVSFGLANYSIDLVDTIGLFYTGLKENSYFGKQQDIGRTVVKCFNNNWYDVNLISYFSSKDFLFEQSKELVHWAMAPIISYDTNNWTSDFEGIDCNLNFNIVNNKQDFQNNSVTYTYPNPASTHFSLYINVNYTTNIEITITTLTGVIKDIIHFYSEQKEEQILQVNTTNYSEGIYFYKIKTKYEILTSSFIIIK